MMHGIQGIATFCIMKRFANQKALRLCWWPCAGKHAERSAESAMVKDRVGRRGFVLFATGGSYIILASEPTQVSPTISLPSSHAWQCGGVWGGRLPLLLKKLCKIALWLANGAHL